MRLGAGRSEAPEHGQDLLHGEADYIGEEAADLLHDKVSMFLDGVGAGLVQGLDQG